MGGNRQQLRCRLRQAKGRDLACLVRAEEEVFGEDAFSPRQWAYVLAAPRSTVILAESGDDLAGYVALSWRLGASTCRIIDLGVRPRFRGKGVARQLLAWVQRHARSKGHAGVTLEVDEANRPARALYRRHGYHLDRKLPHYYQPNRHALRLALWLGPGQERAGGK